MSVREAIESPLTQGSDERIAYVFDFAAIGTPASPEVTVYDVSGGVDVSDDTLDGSASVTDDEVTTPIVYGLTAGKTYRLTCAAVIEGNTISSYALITAE